VQFSSAHAENTNNITTKKQEKRENQKKDVLLGAKANVPGSGIVEDLGSPKVEEDICSK
jgi:hypothetical protein